ncbi:hypothetical protein BJ508DRAFT_313043 [Ascobolus immersus RN42]|uniref:Uncharacterized protein n=1 Tax=Ascobolus immersus RN42 TaxID=1160509 RepID=A0A3N4HK08_ASCIM|nr:hypothetical protein BJ508DRAFT_313043 [Ascobolus immersus RN42]
MAFWLRLNDPELSALGRRLIGLKLHVHVRYNSLVDPRLEYALDPFLLERVESAAAVRERFSSNLNATVESAVQNESISADDAIAAVNSLGNELLKQVFHRALAANNMAFIDRMRTWWERSKENLRNAEVLPPFRQYRMLYQIYAINPSWVSASFTNRRGPTKQWLKEEAYNNYVTNYGEDFVQNPQFRQKAVANLKRKVDHKLRESGRFDREVAAEEVQLFKTIDEGVGSREKFVHSACLALGVLNLQRPDVAGTENEVQFSPTQAFRDELAKANLAVDPLSADGQQATADFVLDYVTRFLFDYQTNVSREQTSRNSDSKVRENGISGL